ncbi:MAG: 3-oxoacyl-ACP reductase FabG [Candidatus Thiodiazotropha lotti]|uniref:3-oxoacyl-[acyl-carrier-protein] reductase n=1 Tax=Candidatus Thiodiazotropha endoloripes TaxID=1818881 RepID=A0A1E2UTC6_9GAMM|nr:3-oxoacyl-ACP reductase FabG [Candidatus Thiodiazotropha endoloripes]MCG7900100.1 3-oxoacyl-ACP reductase FabG [Candidatus Thiodiazotropha weberae]MCG7990869.1 3-oxoacyl-ACP reductase FabG [Candidatus Thiodiazotropha lotti]MCG7901500.1 3-oxoacyl-ACP reductase FabG [Candidatus Thiodiazotropha weberae]MCG7913778.1 3-oxoacyl-ACP reductase FabG [Candidatus Thiodiazotropha weberae]MCG7999267.1 3-oxoacyl-ACP reductase FabG [Candidatus Thiodiazotropha lotti]
MSLENEIALVTGASRGIGAAIADCLASAGATVVGTATSEGGAEAITARLNEASVTGCGMVLDVADQASIDALMSGIAEKYSAPTILVNNAGITNDNLLMRMKDDEWERVINTNLSSVYRLSKGVLRGMMKARKGRIINISSVVGSMGNAGQSNYAAAKAGIDGFTRSLAREVGSRGITVNSVAPGFIETDMTNELPEAQRKSLIENIPLQKLGLPEDIANAVLFLAGASGRYITGETLHVNGGMYMS